MALKQNRRKFLQTTAAAGVGFWVAGGLQAQESKSPNEKIRWACIGVGGKGSSDSEDAARHGDVVAICDIDDTRLNLAGEKKFTGAKRFSDFRKLFEEMEGSIDAVTVSTPDHTHAVVAAMAMRMGKGVYCQKPLTRTIFEARTLGQLAKDKKVCTQMGNQGTAGAGLRKAAGMIKSGALGTVKEVHVWTNRPVWAQGGDRPKEAEVPANIHWELFLGPSPFRPYGPGYTPFAWRGWWDFGSGALGDMACHTMNMPFMGLDLRDPIAVTAETAGHNKDSFPKWSTITYEFAARGDRPALKLYWYDGGKKIDPALVAGRKDPSKKISDSGCLVVGDKCQIYSPNDYGADFEVIGGEVKDVDFVQSPGHFTELANAIKANDPNICVSNFHNYAVPLTETVLLGNLAVWVGEGKRVEWDATNLKSPNTPEVESLVKPTYREGYTL